VVADGSAKGIAGLEREIELGQGGLDDVLLDEGASGIEPSIEIERGDDGFDSVGKEGRLLSASALLFSAPEEKKIAEGDAGSHLSEMSAANERGAEAGEFALARAGKTAEQGLSHSKAQNSVAKKL
jgi:hypothetical protein